jgi:hypothetical protein
MEITRKPYDPSAVHLFQSVDLVDDDDVNLPGAYSVL